MDGQPEVNGASGNNTKIIIPVVIAALVILGVIGVFAYQNMQNPGTTNQMPSATPEVETAESAYKNGTYSVKGNYVSPGGPREIDVSLTLEEGIVTESTFQGHATDPNSKRFQGEFAVGYKEFVIGKNIDEIIITKVAGSSLTPKGFTDALEKIKAQAQV